MAPHPSPQRTGLRSTAWALGLLLLARGTHAQPTDSGAFPHRGEAAGATATPSAGAPSVLRREALVREVLKLSPALAAEQARAELQRREGESARRLPAPVFSVEAAEVPVERPWALQDAGMVRLGFEQMFPPGGARRAMAESKQAEARATEARKALQGRELARQTEHAFADYLEASALLEVHRRRHETAAQVRALAEARMAGGGSLSELAQAEREVVMAQSAVADAEAKVAVARASINGLLLRPADSPLGPPEVPAPPLPADLDALARAALERRPEQAEVRAMAEAAKAELTAARAEQAEPTLSAMVFYYPPTTPMPAHRWGVGFASTLPWLWGEGSAKVAVGEARVQEAHLRQQAVDAETRAELQVAVATARREHTLLRLLEERSLPAARRAEVAASTGYAAGRAPLLEWMMARTAVTDSELDLAMARAALEHTMVELRFAAGSGATAHEGVRHVP